jgi:MFS family permease
MTTAPSERHDPYAAWRHSGFAHYAASFFLLLIGNQAESVAVGMYIFHKTDDPLQLGWIGLVRALPVMLLAIAGGNLADRFNRKWVMFWTLLLGAAGSAGLAAMMFAKVPVGWMYTLLALQAAGQALGGPSRAALLAQIVPGRNFSNAATWSSTTFQVATMVGPVLGGLVVGSGEGAPYVFMLGTVTRLIGVGLVTFLPVHKPLGSGEPLNWHTVAAGIRFVWNRQLILAALSLDLFAVLLGGAVYLLPIFVGKDYLNVSGTGLGVLRATEAAGAICMAMTLAHLPPMKHAGKTLIWAVTGFGMATIIFGLACYWRSFPLALAMVALLGAFDNISVVVRHTLVQVSTPDAMRGRVSAVNNVFITASNDIGGLESGVTAKLFGAVNSVLIGGVGTILVVLGASALWPQLRRIGALKDIKPPEAEAKEGD